MNIPSKHTCKIKVFDTEFDCTLNVDKNKKIFITKEINDNGVFWLKCFDQNVPNNIYGYLDDKEFTLLNTAYSISNDGENRILANGLFIGEHIDVINLQIDNFSFELKNLGSIFTNELLFHFSSFKINISKSGNDAIIHINSNESITFEEYRNIIFSLTLFFNIYSTKIITRDENHSFILDGEKIVLFYTPKYLNKTLYNTKYLSININKTTIEEFYKQYNEFPLIYQLFYNTLTNYEYLVLENKFLAFTYILEAIDRKECKNNETYNLDFKNNKLRKDDCTLKKHLEFLWNRYDINDFIKLDDIKENFQEDIKKTRNTLTHIEKDREYSLNSTIVELMKCIIMYIFSKKLGINTFNKYFTKEIEYYVLTITQGNSNI